MTGGRHAIVLAAGAASRFGGGKLVALWRGEPLIRWSVRAALATAVDGVVLVVGSGAAEVWTALGPIDDVRLTIVEAPLWSEGLSASLRTGLAALPPDAVAAAVFLGDMPAVSPLLADRLLDAVVAGAPAARLLSPLGPAHPTAFAARLFPKLAQVAGDQGGREVLRSLGDQVAFIASDDPGAVFDIDHPADLSRDPGLPLD